MSEINNETDVDVTDVVDISRKAFERFLSLKTVTLFHPESPGVKVVVTRSWVGRLFKCPAFATLTECLEVKL